MVIPAIISALSVGGLGVAWWLLRQPAHTDLAVMLEDGPGPRHQQSTELPGAGDDWTGFA